MIVLINACVHWTSGGTHGERRRWVRAEWGGIWEGCPLSSRLRGLGERRGLPQLGPGQRPGRKRILAYFEGHKTLIFVPIWQNLGGTICISVPAPNYGGLVPLSLRGLRPWLNDVDWYTRKPTCKWRPHRWLGVCSSNGNIVTLLQSVAYCRKNVWTFYKYKYLVQVFIDTLAPQRPNNLIKQEEFKNM